MTQARLVRYEHFRAEQLGDVTVIALADPKLVDYLILEELDAELVDFYELRRPRDVLVDFSQIEWSSTASINSLLKLRARLAEHGGRLKLCGMSAEVRGKFQSLNLDRRVFEICDSRDDALARF